MKKPAVIAQGGREEKRQLRLAKSQKLIVGFADQIGTINNSLEIAYRICSFDKLVRCNHWDNALTMLVLNEGKTSDWVKFIIQVVIYGVPASSLQYLQNFVFHEPSSCRQPKCYLSNLGFVRRGFGGFTSRGLSGIMSTITPRFQQ